MKNKQIKIFSHWYVLIVFLILSSCSSLLRNKPVEIAKAVPNHVIFIVKVNNLTVLDTTLTHLPYGDIIEEFRLLNTLKQNHTAFTSVLSKFFSNQGASFVMLASLHLAKATELNSIHYYPLSISKKEYNRLLAEKFPSASRQEWNYENDALTEVLIPETGTKMTLAYTGGLLIASPESFLVEDAVKQLHSNNGLLSDAAFKKVHNKESNASDFNIWFNLQNLKRWTPTFATPEGSETLSKLDNFATWMLLDVYLKEDEVFMSGITATSSDDVLHQFKKSVGNTNNISEILPFNTALHSNYAQLPDTLNALLSGSGIKNCWSKVLIEPLKKEDINSWICIFEKSGNEVINIEKVEAIGAGLLRESKVYSKQEGTYILVAKKKGILENLYDSYRNKQVLANDSAFLKLNKQLNEAANASIYIRSIYTKEAFRSVYQNKGSFNEDFEKLRGFNQLAFQFNQQNDDLFQMNAHLTFNQSDIGGHTNIVWKTELEENMISGPQIIKINEKGDHGVIVQDSKFQLYLIGKDGDIIWKKQLDSKWLGKASMLKLYDDNAVQFTLNTALSWYLLDEDANNIVGFPLKFKDKATTGMALAKISGKQVAFVGLENQNIYGYEISGKPLTNWNPKVKVGNLKQPIQVVQQEGKTYVTANTDDGKVFIWNESGKQLATTNFNTEFASAFFVDTKVVPFKLKNVKPNGELVSISATGNLGSFQLPVENISQFKMANINTDADAEIVLSDGSTLYYFSYTGSLITKNNHIGNISIIDGTAKKNEQVMLNDQTKQRIKILNDKGLPVSEPDFFIGKYMDLNHLIGDEQTNLVTNGEGKEVICYRISVE